MFGEGELRASPPAKSGTAEQMLPGECEMNSETGGGELGAVQL